MEAERRYPRRLIEVDLPIERISAHARREKMIRQGHISTLHIWWARRPLAACRSVACAALWIDPCDEAAPASYRNEVAEILFDFASKCSTNKPLLTLVGEDWSHWQRLAKSGVLAADTAENLATLRSSMLRFLGAFANWDASNSKPFLDTARRLTSASHSAGGDGGSGPQVIDPFAGGGALPLEAQRIGATAVATDLNPIPVLINRVLLQYIPRHGVDLAEAVRSYGSFILEEARRQLEGLYPGVEGRRPIAYLWARTIRCEGPACGAQLPLVRSCWLTRKGEPVGFRWTKVGQGSEQQVQAELIFRASKGQLGKPTSKGGAATCLLCSYTTPVESVRRQLARLRGGADEAQLIAVVSEPTGRGAREFRAPRESDFEAVGRAKVQARTLGDSAVPDEHLNHLRGFFNVVLYGMERWGDLFSSRQKVALTTFWAVLREQLPEKMQADGHSPEFVHAVQTALACVLARATNAWSSVARWNQGRGTIEGTFQRQALPMVWDYVEANPFSASTGNFAGAVEWVARVCDNLAASDMAAGEALQASATAHPLPDDSADALLTDPPYYDAVPYADLSDYFYVWHRRNLADSHPDLFRSSLTPKDEECVTLAHRAAMYRHKDRTFFEEQMKRALAEARRVVKPSGVGVVVFANKSTAGWEAMLSALVNAGWVITGSWPIDTEMASRLRARGSAVLGSSVHLVCRPRENPDGSVRDDLVGDWRGVLRELPIRIHEWMPRLAAEGVVGADAIFACLGPALEVYSRYSRVEKVSGESVELGEYLEAVWAAVAREALTMIFDDADTSGFEPDARLTAMWLWTLSTSPSSEGNGKKDADEKATTGVTYSLEYDAARKIAQGLGAHLEELANLVVVKGDTGRLLSLSERAASLFDKAEQVPTTRAARRSAKQIGLFAEVEAAEEREAWGELGAPATGETTLDRVHQAMILFGAGRSDALKRFLVEEGVGREPRFWKLAQALSALYPAGSEEKRWVDGVHARKKSLGFG